LETEAVGWVMVGGQEKGDFGGGGGAGFADQDVDIGAQEFGTVTEVAD
jgi:hypothetical protein